MRLPKSQVSTNPQPTLKQVDQALTVVAGSILAFKKVLLSEDALEIESRRIERCIEVFYVTEDHDMQFLEFAANFLKKNSKELVFGTQFSGLYLSEVQDVIKESSDYSEYSVML